MSITRRNLLSSALGAPLAATLTLPAWAQQDWPQKTIKLVVPFPAGGSTDIMGRMIAKQLGEDLGHTVIVENLPGATGTIGVGAVARAKPDGYTLVISSVGPMVSNHFAYGNLPYKMDAIAPVITIAEMPNALMVRTDLGVNSAAELVAHMKANPGKLQHGSTGLASSTHISCELFKLRTNTTALHVPYKGGAPMLQDLVGGTIDFTIDQISSALPLINAGRIKALAVTSRERAPQLPHLPTLNESLLPGFVMVPWFCIGAPAGTPAAIVERVNASVNRMLVDSEVRARLHAMAIVPVGGRPEDLGALIKLEASRMREVAARVNLIAS